MTGRPGDLAPSTQPEPTPEAGAPEANSSGATASFLAELRGAGDAGGGAVGEKKSKLSGPTLLVLGVAGVGVALLFGMRKFAVSGAGEFNPIKIEYTRDAAATARAQTQRSVLDALERGGTPVQVPTDQIKKNPFELAAKATTTADPNPTAGIEDVSRQAKLTAERLRKITDTLATLKLNGVMDGPTPVARINGEMVRVGDTVQDGLFNVVEISGRTVVLEAEGRKYQLQMDASKGAGAAPRRK